MLKRIKIQNKAGLIIINVNTIYLYMNDENKYEQVSVIDYWLLI